MAVSGRWTHPSVVRLAGGEDPIEVIIRRARTIVLEAMDEGWSGPPFDPIELADRLGILVAARADIRDARVLPANGERVRIEYNPNRPAARVRYSLAHEIAHTLFPDCHEQMRNRLARPEIIGDEWQLEALCNLAAAEFLMPVGSLPHMAGEELSIERLMDLRQRFEVSAEALLIRAARLADDAVAAFCATRLEEGRDAGRYRIDYAIPSAQWSGPVPSSGLTPVGTVLGECTAIGFTAKAIEAWPGVPDAYLECVGIPPYPGATYPRVVGMLRARGQARSDLPIHYVRGDATEPRGKGIKLIVHVVNDRTPRWGGRGFAAALARRYREVQEEFIAWAEADRARLRLGSVHILGVDAGLAVASMVAQRGYGPSPSPRIRYATLRDCLEKVVDAARERGASVHMPRIGTGEAGGSWMIVEELLTGTLVAAGVPVTVYDLPGVVSREVAQTDLDFPSS